MPEIGPEHPITYRQELVVPLFQMLRSRESGAVIGAASMGKSRLLQFILRPDVRRHYLSNEAESFLLVRVDCNRLTAVTEWGLYELLLTALIETAGEYSVTAGLRTELNQMRREVILSGNALLAQRYVELAIRMLCQEQGLKLGLIFDEFDESYCTLPSQTLANLRALRDMYKYQLNYLLFLRDHPAELRKREEDKGFYELISRTVFGLKPYSDKDARRIIQQISVRRAHELVEQISEETTVALLKLSGGHPGLLGALLNALTTTPPIDWAQLEWALAQAETREECRKLWDGLRSDERLTLHHLAQSVSTSFQARESLLMKGLISEEQPQQIFFFSPLFQHWAGEWTPTVSSTLHVDVQTGAVWLNGAQCGPLTVKEFDLIKYLYNRQGEICETGEIIHHLYPGDEGFEINENNVATLMRRVRSKIEPDPRHPQHLLNIKGRGYRLII